jgi:hypothetical protein
MAQPAAPSNVPAEPTEDERPTTTIEIAKDMASAGMNVISKNDPATGKKEFVSGEPPTPIKDEKGKTIAMQEQAMSFAEMSPQALASVFEEIAKSGDQTKFAASRDLWQPTKEYLAQLEATGEVERPSSDPRAGFQLNIFGQNTGAMLILSDSMKNMGSAAGDTRTRDLLTRPDPVTATKQMIRAIEDDPQKTDTSLRQMSEGTYRKQSAGKLEFLMRYIGDKKFSRVESESIAATDGVESAMKMLRATNPKQYREFLNRLDPGIAKLFPK